ncbi:hypothetical protein BgiBS90_009700, partial [Biomphalaria glabrata]
LPSPQFSLYHYGAASAIAAAHYSSDKDRVLLICEFRSQVSRPDEQVDHNKMKPARGCLV